MVAMKTVATKARTITPMLEKKLAGYDQLNNIQVPDFMAATGLYFVLDNRNELDIFLSFRKRSSVGISGNQKRRYAHQKLLNTLQPHCLFS